MGRAWSATMTRAWIGVTLCVLSLILSLRSGAFEIAAAESSARRTTGGADSEASTTVGPEPGTFADPAAARRELPVSLALLGLMSLLWLIATRELGRSPIGVRPDASPTREVVVILGLGIVMRLIMLPSVPIREIDLYRYLWDGIVSAEGVNPYAQPPAHWRSSSGGPINATDSIGDTQAHQVSASDPERRLHARLERDPVARRILESVHFPEVPTIYPPTAQLLFHLAELATPGFDLRGKRLMLKTLLTILDVGILLTLTELLLRLGRPPRELILYGWCPLPIKEIANGGHVDVLAVLLTLLAIRVALPPTDRPGSAPSIRRVGLARGCLAGVFLSLAIGAKIYPIALLPLLGVSLLRTAGARSVIGLSLGLAVGLAILWLPYRVPGANGGAPTRGVFPSEPRSAPTPDDREVSGDKRDRGSLAGLTVFAGHWRMYDGLHGLVRENLVESERAPAWYVVTSARFRAGVTEAGRRIASRLGIIERVESPGDLIAKMMVVGCWGLIAALGVRHFALHPGMDSAAAATMLLHWTFLTLAWLWLWSPVANPWYLLWALPLVSFAGSAWRWLVPLALGYYVRFAVDDGELRFGFLGTEFHDHALLPLATAAFLVMLAWSTWRRPSAAS